MTSPEFEQNELLTDAEQALQAIVEMGHINEF
jgi:hypothetical protein